MRFACRLLITHQRGLFGAYLHLAAGVTFFPGVRVRMETKRQMLEAAHEARCRPCAAAHGHCAGLLEAAWETHCSSAGPAQTLRPSPLRPRLLNTAIAKHRGIKLFSASFFPAADQGQVLRLRKEHDFC